MADQALLGDLRERPDGGFDGWCWAPDRPDERLIVDLLVNDTVATSMVAAIFRRDLLILGYGDGRHGFAMRLPANLPDAAGEILITARERRSGHVFARALREAPGFPAPGSAKLDRVEQAVEDLWQHLARARHLVDPPAPRLHDAFAALADRLHARTGAAAERPSYWAGSGVPVGPPPRLPALSDPDMTVAFVARDGRAALRRIDALAPALALARAELLVVDAARDTLAAQLPAQVRNLRYLRDAGAASTSVAFNIAAQHARGGQLVLLGDAPEEPSAAALLALARVTGRAASGLWLGMPGMAAVAEQDAPPAVAARLPAPLGLLLCLNRAAWQALGPLDPAMEDGAGLEFADLAFKARMLGMPVHGVAEPAAGCSAPVAVQGAGMAAVRAARAGFRQRWGALDRARADA